MNDIRHDDEDSDDAHCVDSHWLERFDLEQTIKSSRNAVEKQMAQRRLARLHEQDRIERRKRGRVVAS